jgi:uncharacterized protein YecE (DUF72 family)
MGAIEISRIGTAGWSVPRVAIELFGGAGSQLERYASQFSCTEINTSVYRPHKAKTYERWAASVPSGFRFAVKMPRAITHEAKLRGCESLVCKFLDQIANLGEALGPVIIQLPPSFVFERVDTESFLSTFRHRFEGEAALEPRHLSWFEPDVDELLRAHRLARVAADPARRPEAAAPGGWSGLRYWRWHGSPQMYYSPYGEERLRAMAALLSSRDWCIFDNTASGAAVHDALFLQKILLSHGRLCRIGDH